MKNSILFLDVDGVLNGHDWNPVCQSNTIRHECVAQLNRVLRVTGCHVVVSSAWRYMVIEEALTLRGFEYLLRTHGVEVVGRLLGTTARGEGGADSQDQATRSELIRRWLQQNDWAGRYAVVDDTPVPGHPLVATDPKVGLDSAGADALIQILNGKVAS